MLFLPLVTIKMETAFENKYVIDRTRKWNENIWLILFFFFIKEKQNINAGIFPINKVINSYISNTVYICKFHN